MSAEDYIKQVVAVGKHDSDYVPLKVDADGSLILSGFEYDTITPDTTEATTWDTTLVSLVSNLNRIRNQIKSITGEAWGTVSHSIETVWAKFHATTGHKHTGATADAPTLDHGLLTGLADDDHTLYFLANGTRAFSGSGLARDVDNSYINILGGTLASGSYGLFRAYGKDAATYTGGIIAYVSDAAKTGFKAVFYVIGGTDTPIINWMAREHQNAADPTVAQGLATKNYVDAVGKAWAAWTPSLTWTTGTPASVTTTARYTRIGRVVFFYIRITSTDANGAAGLTISLPVTAYDPGCDYILAGFENYYDTAYRYVNPFPYIDTSASVINFYDFKAALDGYTITLRIEGFYEVA